MNKKSTSTKSLNAPITSSTRKKKAVGGLSSAASAAAAAAAAEEKETEVAAAASANTEAYLDMLLTNMDRCIETQFGTVECVFAKISEFISPRKVEWFIDVGSGRGKLCLYVANNIESVKKCVGVEMDRDRHGEALRLLQEVKTSTNSIISRDAAAKIYFVCSDILRIASLPSLLADDEDNNDGDDDDNDDDDNTDPSAVAANAASSIYSIFMNLFTDYDESPDAQSTSSSPTRRQQGGRGGGGGATRGGGVVCVWFNNEGVSPKVSAEILMKAVRELPDGSIIVLHNDPFCDIIDKEDEPEDQDEEDQDEEDDEDEEEDEEEEDNVRAKKRIFDSKVMRLFSEEEGTATGPVWGRVFMTVTAAAAAAKINKKKNIK